MNKTTFISLFLIFMSFFSLYSQGALQEEPDPQEELIQSLEVVNEFIPIPEITPLYTHPNDGRLAEAAYRQFSRATLILSQVIEAGGVEAGYEQLPFLRALVQDWVNFWNGYSFLPEDGQITAAQMKGFLETIHTIDREVTETITIINENTATRT